MLLRYAGLCTALLLSAMTTAEEAILNIYNWSDYIGETTIADFEREFGVKVNYDVYDSASTVDAKLMAGKSGYDVIVHSASFSSRLQEAGIFLPLDRSKIPNWKHLDPELLQRFAQYDAGNRYGLPYMWGTTGFTYNEDMILARMPDAPVDSAAMMFDPDVVAHFADCGVSILEAPIDVIPMALLYLGRDGNSMSDEDLKAAEDVLKNVRPYLRYYSSTKFMLDLPSGEMCLAGTWSGDYAVATTRAREAGLDIKLKYTIPKEGSTIWFDAAYIPADAPHPDNAHAFLNFLMRPQVIAQISNFTGYANANSASLPFVLPQYANDPAIYPDAQTRKRLVAAMVEAPKIERRRTRAWTRAKTGL
jgi:putrescine transport system substrate-binding protein